MSTSTAITFFAILSMVLCDVSNHQCSIIEKNIYDLHGVILKLSVPTKITLCNTSLVEKNHPIRLISQHSDYFKFKFKHIRTRNEEDKLPHLYNHTFQLLPDLRSLVISQVELETIETNSFEGLTNLTYLSLYDNKLASLPEGLFDNLPSLIELNLNNNMLVEIKQRQFEKLTNLQTLRLSANNLNQIPSEVFLNLNALEYLSLSRNHLDALKTNTFQGLKDLKSLTLIMNNLGVIEEDAFKGLGSLEKLSLEYNRMIVFVNISCELENMPKLVKVSLSPESFICIELQAISELLESRKVQVLQLSKHSETCQHRNRS